jgi:tRNA1Val (adenine37-N6)-methyltransferase
VKVELLPEETLDDLRLGGLQIIQRRDGYRFSIDPVLLCDFVRSTNGSRSVVDLGTGNGVIAMILARLHKRQRFIGVERQEAMVERARRSVVLNGLDDRVDILQADIRQLPAELKPNSFDVVVSNPPFRHPESGRVAPDSERAAARHELSGGVSDFLGAAGRLLKNGGMFYTIFLAERLTDLLTGMREVKLEPKRLRLVHSRQGEPARLVLAEGCKDARPGLTVEPPLIVYRGAGRDYTAEVSAIYDANEE